MSPDDYWFPWYPTKFSRDTQHLGLAEDAAYRRLIDAYMQHGEPLPDNDAALARMIGVGKDEWLTVAPAVRPFFEASNGKLVHSRCHKELMQQACLKHGYSIRGHAGADARWKDLREKKRQDKHLMLQASVKHAWPMPNDATRQDIRKKEDGEPLTARPPATALPTGARAVEPISEQVAKRPSEVSRAELDARIATRRMGKTA
jgi:uncharacterized protein YdaU (DUF1376 family)